MAAAALTQAAGRLTGVSTILDRLSESQNNCEAQQVRGHILAQADDSQLNTSPDQVTKNSEENLISGSSKTLRIEDFELIKTLGTGENRSPGGSELCCRARTDSRLQERLRESG
jgi:hypothetical protein